MYSVYENLRRSTFERLSSLVLSFLPGVLSAAVEKTIKTSIYLELLYFLFHILPKINLKIAIDLNLG